MRAACIVLVALLAPVAAAGPLLTAVVADLPGSHDGEEGVAIGSDVDVDLSGWAVTDGEGTWHFPAGARLAGGEEAWLVGDAGLWSSFDGPSPRWVFDLRLGNGGDDVLLLRPDGSVADAFAYGEKATPHMAGRITYTSEGLVYRRFAASDDATGLGGLGSGAGAAATPVRSWLDTDHADDWRTPRPHRMGESSVDAPRFQVSALTLYASPDNSFDVLTGLLAQARQRVHLHVYDLTESRLVDALVDSKLRNPGIDLQVLLEDAPVGLEQDQDAARTAALARVAAAGGEAWLAGSARYRYHHLKVLIVDDAVAVQSENWVPTGVPPSGSYGSRGWGIVVHDRAVADWFSALLQADRDAWDTAPFLAPVGQAEPLRHAPLAGPYQSTPARRIEGTFWITPIVSPEHTADPQRDPVARLIAGAGSAVWSQQLDVRLDGGNALGWGGQDALYQALAGAALRGLDVRLQVAAPFHRDDTGNRDVLAALAAAGVAGRELDRDGLAYLHNKGTIVDGRYVVVGSMNGNHHSRSMNREVGLLVDSPEAAAYFGALFAADWSSANDRDWGVVAGDLRALPTQVPTLFLALLVAVSCRCYPR